MVVARIFRQSIVFRGSPLVGSSSVKKCVVPPNYEVQQPSNSVMSHIHTQGNTTS